MSKPVSKGGSDNGGLIRTVDFATELSDRYLSYALSTIMSRSLPDVRDGLKPVQRRLLYAMRELKLDPSSGYKKSARVVGDVIGKYHPHGDASIYDAMVRLAQNFAQRYPLVDGQGNFGNIDGDNPAAMRYTEARMTLVARFLLEGLDEDAVDFRATYDGEDHEPVVLPANFPNLLANGAQGIAVGMATSIPPHNAGEICDALLHLIDQPQATPTELLQHMPGPDFPTGGIIVEPKENIRNAYETGRGSFRIRARYEVEQLKGGAWQVIITEIPFQVVKSRLIERVSELMINKKLHLVADFRDESTEDVRVVVEPKSRNVDPQLMMESLFRQTDLESRVSLNMNVLGADNVPRVMNLAEVLQEFLNHRHEVLIRRTENRVGKVEKRLHLLDGFLIAFLNIDELIRIIREEDEPKQEIMRTFGLSDIQAEAILNMRLRALRKLEEDGIRKEHSELSEELKKLQALLGSRARRWKAIGKEIAHLKSIFGDAGKADGRLHRLSTFADAPEIADLPVTAMVEKEPVTLVLSKKGWLRAIKGHNAKPEEIKYKDGDAGAFVVPGYTTDRFVLIGTNGRAYTLAGDRLPGGRGFGEPLSLFVDLPADARPLDVRVFAEGQKLLLASTDGRGFVTLTDDLVTNHKAGKLVLNVKAPVEAKFVRDVEGDLVAAVGTNRRLLVFTLEELPEMPRGKGVIIMRFAQGILSDIKTFKGEDGLSWKWGEGRQRTEADFDAWRGKRGTAGRLVPNGFSKDNSFG